MSIGHAYAQWAPTYDQDRNLTRDLDRQVTRQLLAGHRTATLVEAGCGTGKNTAFYASLAEDVVALDFTEAMLDKARRREGCANVRFLRHDLSTPWPVSQGSAGLIVFNLVLEHIDDLANVLAHAVSACRGGAVVHISELHPYRQYGGSQARFCSVDGEVRIPAFVHHVSDYVRAAELHGLRLHRLGEWWHEEDQPGRPPRLLTLQLIKP